MNKRHSDLAVPPGEYLAEVTREQGMDKIELAEQLCLSATEMGALLAGNAPLTPALAGQLEKATSVPANIWLGLEEEYRLALASGATHRWQEAEFGRSDSL